MIDFREDIPGQVRREYIRLFFIKSGSDQRSSENGSVEMESFTV